MGAFTGRARRRTVGQMAEQTIPRSSDPTATAAPGARVAGAGLTSAMLADSLDAAGWRDQVMERRIVPLVRGTRVLGRARTLQFAPTESDQPAPYQQAVDLIDSLEEGQVVVIATGGDGRTAYWGELFSAAAMGRGAAGTVCDGPVRDVAKVLALGYGVFSWGARPLDFRARMRVVGTDCVVRCGGVVVAPGDLVMGDDDGVVAVPGSVEAKVMALAAERSKTERAVLDALLAGALLEDVWQRWHVL